MCHAAILGNTHFVLDDCELHRPAPSYTFDTVSHLRATLASDDRIAWLVGTDHLLRLHTWHRFEELITICDLTVMKRAGQAIDFAQLDPRVASLAARAIDVPAVPISSTAIRARVRAGIPITGLVPPAVEQIILREKLYFEPAHPNTRPSRA
jgi:nicotinate-nucleotide adenylyltransferase